MYLRADIAHAWQGLDPFVQAFALTGDVLREMPGRRTLRVRIGTGSYVLKLHFGVGWAEILKNLVAGRAPVLGARNEYAAVTRLGEAGVPGMRVAAFGEQGGNPARRRSFVLLDDIAHDESLEDVARRWARAPAPVAQRRATIAAVAMIVRGMHAAGVNHRDCYLCHFLCAHDGGLRLIDLHRAGIRAQVPLRWRVKDLAQLWFSAMDAGLAPRDRLRFVRDYSGGRLPRDAQAWAMWRKVERDAHVLHEKGRRLGIVS